LRAFRSEFEFYANLPFVSEGIRQVKGCGRYIEVSGLSWCC